jgi:hypothetical protein
MPCSGRTHVETLILQHYGSIPYAISFIIIMYITLDYAILNVFSSSVL